MLCEQLYKNNENGYCIGTLVYKIIYGFGNRIYGEVAIKGFSPAFCGFANQRIELCDAQTFLLTPFGLYYRNSILSGFLILKENRLRQ